MHTAVTKLLGRDHTRKLLMLRTLWWYTARNEYPTATELAYQSDTRDVVPRGTLSSRRTMIRQMRDVGLITLKTGADSPYERLQITDTGIDLIKLIDMEASL